MTQCPFFWVAGAAAAGLELLDAQPPRSPGTSESAQRQRIEPAFIGDSMVKNAGIGKIFGGDCRKRKRERTTSARATKPRRASHFLDKAR